VKALPPIPNYNNIVFAVRRKIIRQILQVIDYHWEDLENNIPPVYHQKTHTYRVYAWRQPTDHEIQAIISMDLMDISSKAKTPVNDIIWNDTPDQALKHNKAWNNPHKPNLRDPRIYQKRKRSSIPLSKALEDAQLSQSQIDSTDDLPQQKVIEVITLDSPPRRDTDSPIAVYHTCTQLTTTYWYSLSK
jgi:hypothetical protein